jgi:hypothetical protein
MTFLTAFCFLFPFHSIGGADGRSDSRGRQGTWADLRVYARLSRLLGFGPKDLNKTTLARGYAFGNYLLSTGVPVCLRCLKKSLEDAQK